MRKVVQLVCSGGSLYALCDDGTIWLARGLKPTDWEQVPTPPEH